MLEEVDLAVCYTITDRNLAADPIPPFLVWGPNMAIRKRVFDLGHQFDLDAGPSGAN